ncbi:radical SAM protein [Mangrovimonas sp. TPBH4]|uniref:B12-binding domain-containing radical SAM protein n=1 Tax=Mangrovimonas sp. TPBH4 TaxID=1645914 RepID=UPI0006B57B16|nr:radical SAM protein [Mangrovimonas sp. TPBH4]
MKILLTHSYFLNEDEKEAKIMKPYPPLGLLYISAYLKEHQLEHSVFDSTFSSFKEQLDYIKEQQPKIVAIYTNLMTKINVIKCVKLLKQHPDYGFPKIILGGPDITYNCENYLKTGADYLIIGEGEQSMLELSEAILNHKETETIPGIAFLKNSKVITTVSREKIKDLSILPIPNREAIDLHPYLTTWKQYHGKSSMTVSTQRGCPYTCKWCSTAVYGQSYRRRPAKLVVEELKLLKETYNPDAIWFVDDVFTVSHKWMKEFHNEMRAQNFKIPFECITRAERLTDDILEILKDLGCFRIWIGAESGSQKIIEAMDRRVDVDVVKSAIQKTNALGMESGTFIMIGYPGEEEEDIKQTINYLKEASPTHFTITLAYPIKGTSLYNEIQDNIITQPDWETSTDRDIDFKRTYSRNYYNYALKYIVNELAFHRNMPTNKVKAFKHKSKALIANSIMQISK